MTEQEWLECVEPKKMLKFVRGKLSERRRRLLAVAFCGRVVHLFWDESLNSAIEVAERHADGKASDTELAVVREEMSRAYMDAEDDSDEVVYGALWAAADFDHEEEVEDDDFTVNVATHVGFASEEPDKEPSVQCDLIRDIVGNPYRVSPAVSSSCWRANGGTANTLAQTIYEERAFDRLPILADALEDAGCDNGDLLDHLRQPAQHVLGCWALVLGKV